MLNYSTHAITDILALADHYVRSGQTEDARAMVEFVGRVRDAVKFTLPDRGTLIYDIARVPDGVEITRLPFRQIVVEVPFSTPENMGRDMIPATRRLILAREGHWDQARNHYEDATGEPGAAARQPNAIKVDIACHVAPHGWTLQPVGAILLVGSRSENMPDDPTDAYAHDKFGGAAFHLITAPTMPALAERMWRDMGQTLFLQNVGHDTSTEIRILAEMMTVLSCQNVGMTATSPPEKLARARLKAGKEPFYDTMELTVGEGRIGGSGQASGQHDGYQVRQHLRRGHVRRLGPDRRIWVNQALVAGGSTAGAIDKAYRVKAPG